MRMRYLSIICCVACATFIMLTGHQGWGWLIAVAIILGVD